MLQWSFLLSLGIVAHVIVFAAYFWQVKHADELRLFGQTYSSIYTFWAAYGVLQAVVFYPANYLFSAAYWYGYKFVFPGTMWLVVLTSTLSSIVVLLVIIGWYFRELPAGNAAIAFIGLGITTAALHWK